MHPLKDYDCIPHDLLLEAYKLDKVALKLALVHISRRNKRGKIDFVDSAWMKILGGSPQDLISCSTLFNTSLMFNMRLICVFLIKNILVVNSDLHNILKSVQ